MILFHALIAGGSASRERRDRLGAASGRSCRCLGYNSSRSADRRRRLGCGGAGVTSDFRRLSAVLWPVRQPWGSRPRCRAAAVGAGDLPSELRLVARPGAGDAVAGACVTGAMMVSPGPIWIVWTVPSVPVSPACSAAVSVFSTMVRTRPHRLST